MESWICITCGTSYPESEAPPAVCSICDEERQYIRAGGQQWTTLTKMSEAGYRNVFDELEPGLVAIRTEPTFAIGERGHLIQTPFGNVLWDCFSYIDDATVEAVRARGGIRYIAISHPHFYSTMADWAERFNATILLHESNREWVVRPTPRLQFWQGESYQVNEQITLVRMGGHFPGSTILHWKGGAAGKGAIFTGDTITVVPDTRWVSFMYSYPNLLPLPAATVRRIADRAASYEFDRIYGGWQGRVVQEDGRNAVLRSAERYIRALETVR